MSCRRLSIIILSTALALWAGRCLALPAAADCLAKFDLSERSNPQLWEALLQASRKGTDDVVECILSQRRVNVNVLGSLGDSALLRAVARRHESTARLLLRDGLANPDPKLKYGITPMKLAQEAGLANMVFLLRLWGQANENFWGYFNDPTLCSFLRYGHILRGHLKLTTTLQL
ncbi:hypothetical protein CDD83_4889 [Cordyceps sp. RAO-2017]|nr:hypothetical protein CDD83_4889 [Cordyceps sp. RAO-2017]